MKNKDVDTRVQELLKVPFLKLRSDYAFKKVFGSPSSEKIIIQFLNALFEGHMEIADIEFRNKEILPADPEGKRIVYDLYCTTTTGYHFIVEMQQEASELFGKRMVFYASSCVRLQGESGGTYNFSPVYLIVITDFNMRPLDKKLVNEVLLMERESKIVYTEDLKIFFLSLPQVPKRWEECETKLQKLLFLIKNMEKLNKESKPYKSGEYKELFHASMLSNLAAEEMAVYEKTLIRELEMESAREYAYEEGIERGIEQVARRMKERGVAIGDIMLNTGLTQEQVESL